MNAYNPALAKKNTIGHDKKYWVCRLAVLLSDVFSLFLSYVLSLQLAGFKGQLFVMHRDSAIFFALILVCLALFVTKGHYSKRIPFWDELRQMLKGVFLVGLLHTAIVVGMNLTTMPRALAFAWLFALVLLPCLRVLTKTLLLKVGLWSYPSVIIGDGENAEDTAKALADERMMGYEIKHFLSIDEPKRPFISVKGRDVPVSQLDQDFERHFRALDNPHIIVALERGGLDRIQHYVDRFSLFYPRLSVVPALRGLPLFGADMHSFFSHEVILLNLRNNLAPISNRFIKRTFDLIVSALLLLMLSPLFLYVALKIRDSGGTVFFAHTRIGRGGKPFPCYKFRSMVPNAQEILDRLLKTDPVAKAEWDKDFKLKNDPRITKIGQFLRKTSLDELPQLWNVFKGDMSLVGPRPVIAAEVERYGEKAVNYYQAKPGMTGLWQVSGRNDVDYDSRIYLDAWYVKNWNLWTDIVIMLRTFDVVLNRDGAY
jgi:undecaprenyl-phosphate galactose phosphotransferase